jgi:ribosomal protein S18 acetylase RimI-like enzyme
VTDDVADRVRAEDLMIRRARPSDVPYIAQVMRDARTAAMPWLPVLHSVTEDLEFFGRQVEANATYVAAIADRVVGFAVVDELEHSLEHLYLDPGLRRRGIGSVLLAHVRSCHPEPLVLWCFTDNTAARAFYRAQGAEELYETDGRDNEERTPDVRLRLPAVAE